MPRRPLVRFPMRRGPLRLALCAALSAGPAHAVPEAGVLARDTGFENVQVRAERDSVRVAFENRRYRHSARALGVLAAATSARAVWVERRLGLEMAAVRLAPADAPGWIERLAGVRADSTFRVRYPSDDPFWPALRGTPARPTARTLDLTVGPRFRYEFGRVFEPFLFSLDLEPRLRWNPWTGARATASVLIPLHNDFERGELQPDIGRVRPGGTGLEQYAWLPGLALGSLHGGYFGENRYGGSLGLARPLDGGRWLVDSQVDVTGFVSFTEGEILYSTPTRWTGFAGLAWHAPVYDLSLRARLQWFLFGDRGIELQARREIGDLGVAFYYQRIEGDGIQGVRLDIPVPPAVRGTGTPVRVMPVERFPITYDDRGRAIGSALTGTASREALLEQLDAPALDANAHRYRRGAGASPAGRRATGPGWVSLAGTTGLATIPWAGTIGDRMVEIGYTWVPERWAYDFRGVHPNAYYFGTIGFLPQVEVQLRWTQIVGRRDFEEIVPDSRLADLDRTAGVRIALIPPAEGRPGLAIGMDDVVGTRRFHSTYAVAGLPAAILGVRTRTVIGYAPTAFAAARHVLDGVFGGVEVHPWRALRLQVEYDSEKWNAGIGVAPGLGLRLRVAALDLESLSVGAGWSWPL